jgi:hypothetical protein
MTDTKQLIERLRAGCPSHWNGSRMELNASNADALMDEAADEIERLSALQQPFLHEGGAGAALVVSEPMTDERDEEIARLREALGRLIEAADSCAWSCNTSMMDGSIVFARTALGEG